MARRKREPMSEGKKNIIGMLLEEYDIKSAKDIEDALKDLLGGTIQEMLESEMDEHLGYQEYERSSNPDYRNGRKTKKIRGNFGETEIEVPQDRDGSFEPKVVKKRQKDISGIEQKIIALYAKGMTTRQISETIEDIYGFEVSDGMVSDITDRLLPQIEDWQKRPLDEVYPIVFIDAVHFSVRDNGQIRKLLSQFLNLQKFFRRALWPMTMIVFPFAIIPIRNDTTLCISVRLSPLNGSSIPRTSDLEFRSFKSFIRMFSPHDRVEVG